MRTSLDSLGGFIQYAARMSFVGSRPVAVLMVGVAFRLWASWIGQSL
uniref:Uncharacterized protein n=1 Tax=uncultured bacterium contig00001 TaxID=1181493 RepID=A0A806KJT3_9BACT|nr:hypothetical protein [uncultured bacterium contig00001]